MNKHDTDVTSLTSGLVFLALVGWWLMARWITVAPPSFGWFAGAALIIAGVSGVLATSISWRARAGTEPPADPTVQQP